MIVVLFIIPCIAMMSLIARFFLACALFCAIFGTSFVLAHNDSSHLKFPLGDPRNCPLSNGAYRFEVLPGSGWDNLRNQHMGVVSLHNYSKCSASEDGRYLLPDDVVLYPIKESKVHTFAELYEHWANFSSMTARSINVEASVQFKGIGIGGSFSSEFQSVKKHQVEDKAVTTRVQMRHVLYTAKLQPGSALQPVFKSHLLEIASHLQHNNTAYANFLAQLLVRDFGTHFITSVKAGAILAKVDHLTKKFFFDLGGNEREIKANAHLSFLSFFNLQFGTTSKSDVESMKQYAENTVYSTVLTIGGPPFRANFSIDQWEDQLIDDLVAVDRSGDPLHYAITPDRLPELSDELTFKLANVVERAIKLYYEQNTIKGCTLMDSPNFSFQSNLEDGSCESSTNNYTFGGVFQTCQFQGSPDHTPCEPLLQKNPLTSAYTCSDDYEPVLVHQGRTPYGCYVRCERCLFFFKCCGTKCGFATYSTYWCVAKGPVPANTGYLFGGLYSKVLKNPVTQDHSCPLKFYPLHFGATMQVCVSDDYELGYGQSVPFGGFFSCKAGNPLGVSKSSDSGQGSNLASLISESGPSGWPKSCPTGHSQHLGAIEDDCALHFCVRANIFNSQGLPIIKRPPYSSPPKIFNYSVPLLLVNEDTGLIWFKRPNSFQWTLATKRSVLEFADEINVDGPGIVGMNLSNGTPTPDEQKSSQGTPDKMDAGAAASITFGVTAFVGLAIAVMVIGWRRRRSVHRDSRGLIDPLKLGTGYGTSNDDSST